MTKVYRCPKCDSSVFVWDRKLKQYVCPNDKTPLLEFIPEDDAEEVD